MLVFILLYLAAAASATAVQKTTADFVSQHGYKIQSVNNIITKDGYILKMFYMPPADHCLLKDLKSPVFIMHGHFSCSDIAVLAGPENGLAFQLVNDCHPVYLGNARSNLYCQRHQTLSIDSPEFWNFSYYEIALYDLGAMIDIIYGEFSAPVDLVGHSQGCIEIITLLTERSIEYKVKVGTVILVTPATFMHHVKYPLIKGLANEIACQSDVKVNAQYISRNFVTTMLGPSLCGNDTTCDSLSKIVLDWTNDANETLVKDFGINHPAGNSFKEFKHLLQGFCSEINDFKRFDYGLIGNLERYGQDIPPGYDLSKLTSEIIVFYGDGDTVTAQEDVEHFISLLPNVKVELIKGFNHLDFFIAKSVKKVSQSITSYLSHKKQ